MNVMKKYIRICCKCKNTFETDNKLSCRCRFCDDKMIRKFKMISEHPTTHEEALNWELPKSIFRVSRVAFNKCKTSRKRKGIAEELAGYQDSYRRYCGEIKTTNKKHHGFVMGHPVNGGLLVICDDAKIRIANGNDVVYL